MTLDELKASAFVVGLKETERAIDRGEAGHVSSRRTVMTVFHCPFAMSARKREFP